VASAAPLKLALEPGDYRVRWDLPTAGGTATTSLDGDLELLPDRAPRGHAHGEVDLQWEGPGADGSKGAAFPQIYPVASIFGTLLNGMEVQLLDAEVEIWFPGRATINARAALVGRQRLDATTLGVKSFEVQVEGLDAVSGIGPIRETRIPLGKNDQRRHLDVTLSAIGNPDSTQQWRDDSVDLKLSFSYSVTPADPFRFNVATSPTVRGTFVEAAPFDEVVSRWIEPLRRIIALSTKRQEKTTYLSIEIEQSPGVISKMQVFGSALHQSPFASDGNEVMKLERAFFVSPQDMSLLDLFRRWQDLMAEHHPLLETYGSMMFAPEQHPRNRFLLLVQAIEGLVGHETRDAHSARLQRHLSKRDAVLEETASLSPEARKFLKRFLLKSPPSSLEDKLRAAFEGVPVDVQPKLALSPLIAGVVQEGGTSVLDALRRIRNDLAHGYRGFDPQETHEVAVLLESVVRAHLLRILGCSLESQRRDQERRA
jgi:hypothetical protein